MVTLINKSDYSQVTQLFVTWEINAVNNHYKGTVPLSIAKSSSVIRTGSSFEVDGAGEGVVGGSSWYGGILITQLNYSEGASASPFGRSGGGTVLQPDSILDGGVNFYLLGTDNKILRLIKTVSISTDTVVLEFDAPEWGGYELYTDLYSCRISVKPSQDLPLVPWVDPNAISPYITMSTLSHYHSKLDNDVFTPLDEIISNTAVDTDINELF